ncbi:MFS transporter [Lacihabitans lacunae]|uniref:MFS transporter n=1 Tax=Lacihabitans lacunae TaxID=1028214 RepID=A0ABV7YTS8_9BACT
MNFINNKKIWNAWSMYDWANSVHNLVITTVIFPIYYHATAVNAQGGDLIDFLGFQVNNDVLYSYTLSVASIFLVILNPILTGIADYSGRKKMFMKIFCYLGSASCAYFYFFTKDNVTSAIIAFGFSIIGWGGSIVFYNAFIPQIATEENYDKLSARGFVFGYIGSVILLIFNLVMIIKPEFVGLTEADSKSGFTSRLAFLTVGIWWAGFAQIPFYFLPKDESKSFQKKWLKNGFLQLKHVFLETQKQKYLKRFLAAFFIYDMGVMTVIYVATIFADKELQIPRDGLIATLLLIQLVAIPGSYLASFLSSKYGNTIALRIEIIVWSVVPVAAYFTTEATQFYVIAAIVGLVMGGIQALSRSTFAKLIPDNEPNTAAYFAFYDITEKMAIALGTFIFGFIIQLTGNMRYSILFLIVLFAVGFILLTRIPSKNIYRD